MEEMQGQIVIFLAAAYETTAITLALVAYHLALNPNVQSKLYEEIDEYFPIRMKTINYETVQRLPYLDMVFCEVSRIASVAILAMQRICINTTNVNGIFIPKGKSYD